MDADIAAAAAGLGTGLSLIVAIGAQNAFVLRQGIRRQHVPAIVGICALSDAALIVLGVAGLGALVRSFPGVITGVTWIGATFLVGYGLLAARRAVRPGRLVEESGAPDATGGSLASSVLSCLGFTWLNPHVYLDTVLLLGTVAAGYGSARWMFALGAAAGSMLWFSGLGFGARLLRPVFARPGAWRTLDLLIAATMLAMGVALVLRG
jgi:L-lysine exporter family protein LysE/ArgO